MADNVSVPDYGELILNSEWNNDFETRPFNPFPSPITGN